MTWWNMNDKAVNEMWFNTIRAIYAESIDLFEFVWIRRKSVAKTCVATKTIVKVTIYSQFKLRMNQNSNKDENDFTLKSRGRPQRRRRRWWWWRWRCRRHQLLSHGNDLFFVCVSSSFREFRSAELCRLHFIWSMEDSMTVVSSCITFDRENWEFDDV